MSEGFKSFLQWPLWVKISILVSALWCFGWYIASSSNSFFGWYIDVDRENLFLLGLIPIILYWGLAWIFHKSANIYNISILVILILIASSFYGFIIVDDYLTNKTANRNAAALHNEYNDVQFIRPDKLRTESGDMPRYGKNGGRILLRPEDFETGPNGERILKTPPEPAR